MMQRVPILSLFVANAISMAGNVLAAIAIPWFVLQTTGSAAQTGITGFFTVLPVVLAGFLGGALIDRLGYKPTSIVADLASGVTVALIPLLHFTIGLQFWELMLLVFLGGLLDTPGTTARSALIPELAALAKMPLERATSIGQTVERGSRLIGAPLAGLLITLLGTANVLWLDAASFLISAAVVAVTIRPHATASRAAARGKYFEEIRSGLQFIQGHQLVLSLVAILMLTNFLDAVFTGVLLPVYVIRVFGNATNLGAIFAVFGGGAILGGTLFGAIGHRMPRYATFVTLFFLASLQFWAFALYQPFWVILIAAGLGGIAASPLNPIIDTVLFERVPSDMRGRVLGSVTAGAWLTMPLGMLLAGFLTEAFGLQTILIAVALAYPLATLSMIFVPALRELDRRIAPGEIAGDC
jgi:MFS family permease